MQISGATRAQDLAEPPFLAAEGTHPLDQSQARSLAYAGLMTSLMISNRSSKGMNALFIALMVNHCSSAQP